MGRGGSERPAARPSGAGRPLRRPSSAGLPRIYDPGGVSGGQRLRERRASGAGAPAPVAARPPVFGIWLWSRTAIWAAALFALFTFQPNRNPFAYRWDDPKLTHDLGAIT